MAIPENNIDSTIEKVRDYWQLGEALITLVAARENRIYRVETSNGSFALRFHRQGYRSMAEIRSELMWMSMLEENNIPVPKPVKTSDGDSIKLADDVVVDMLTWVGGEPLKQLKPTEEMYHELGVLLARMHQLADAWPLPESFERPTWDLVGDDPSWGRFWQNPKLSNEQQSRFLDFRDAARNALADLQQPDQGLIHADLVPENILYNGRELQPIDFDDGGFGYRLFDLATITHRSRRLQNGQMLVNAVIVGYQHQRTLDLESLPLFEAMRACTYVGWNIARLDEPGAAERNERFIREAEVSLGRYYDTCQ